MSSIVETAIQGRYKKIKENAERIRREKRGMKKARRFHTRLDSLYPGEDQISKVKRRAQKTRPREVQQAKPEEISKDIINNYNPKEPKTIRDNPYDIEEGHYNKFRQAYLDLKKKLEIQLIKDNKQNEICLETTNPCKSSNVKRELN